MSPQENEILQLLSTKSSHKQATYRNTLQHFQTLGEVLQELGNSLTKEMKVKDPNVEIQLRKPNMFDLEFKFSGDTLVFSMHSNVFTFDHKHFIHQTEYIQQNPLRAYFGVINVYNFLSDSYKYARLQDLGYLIGRIFVNLENHFFVEGNKSLGFTYSDFRSQALSREILRDIAEKSILQSLDFDLYAPPYDQVQIISVGQKMTENANAGLSTGKRLGYQKD